MESWTHLRKAGIRQSDKIIMSGNNDEYFSDSFYLTPTNELFFDFGPVKVENLNWSDFDRHERLKCDSLIMQKELKGKS